MNTNNKKIIFIGLGKMGEPIALNLLKKNFNLIGFDINKKVRNKFNKSGGKISSTLKEGISDSDIIITMLPNGKIVNEVLFGKQKNIINAKKGALIIDMSSSNPIDTINLGKKLSHMGFSIVDAPVSGGVKRAKNSSISIMIGGSKKNKLSAITILKKIGKNIFDTGSLGTAHAMKALNNYVSACGLVAACEAVIVGKKFGINDQTIIEVLNTSTGKNNSTETKMKQFVLSEKFSSGFNMSLMSKDLLTAKYLSEELNINAKGIKNASNLWKKASKIKKLINADHTEIFKYLLKS